MIETFVGSLNFKGPFYYFNNASKCHVSPYILHRFIYTSQKAEKKKLLKSSLNSWEAPKIYKWHQKGIKNDVRCRQTLVNQGFFVGFTSFRPYFPCFVTCLTQVNKLALLIGCFY